MGGRLARYLSHSVHQHVIPASSNPAQLEATPPVPSRYRRRMLGCAGMVTAMPNVLNRYKRLTELLCLLLVLFSPSANASDATPPADVAMLNFTLGKVGIADNIDTPLRYGIEYRMRALSTWKVIPAFGFAHAESSASFLYTDLRHDFWLTDRWVAIPSFGVGAFDDGDDIQLGKELEFRSGIEIAYRFHKQYRIGIALFHLSNGGLGRKNPGTESLVMSLSIPLGN
tara:strand:- start:597 stop:1277 length:681 start_codon:yes stop_codon:yes gene_type:complete